MNAADLVAGAQCSTYTDSPSCGGAARGCSWNTPQTKCEDMWTIAKLTPLCHPCTLAYVTRILFALKVMDALMIPDLDHSRQQSEQQLILTSYVVNGVCATDLKDNYCVIQLQQQPTDYSCAGMTNYLKTVGCCAPSVLNFQQGLCNVDKTVNPTTSTCQAQLDAVNSQIASCPNLQLGKTCALLKYLLVHQAILSGIAPAWLAIQANHDALIVELKKVIAYAVGVDVSLIIDLTLAVAAATPGTGRRLLDTPTNYQMTSTVTVPQASASQSATEGLAGNLDTLGVGNLLDSTTPGGSLSQPTITGQSVTNIAVPPNSNEASSATPMLALAAVACIFLH